ncbi:MAG TPA: class I SAM-dependent methyltransferase [Mycobacteriales bacterium]|nr:class I SAM-dependent methyltransferase [Mycobacteriales bacterium]
MNQGHLEFLASPHWAELLKTDLLPWVDSVGDLGDNVIEIGPGPGLTTDLVRPRVETLTAIELDDDLAAALAARMAGTNVEVLHADATSTGLPSGEFSTVLCFSMLHHMTSPALQDRLFAEVARLLCPGGMFVGVDALDSDFMREAHIDDTFVPVGVETVADRFRAAGLHETVVEPADYQFRFRASRPAS